MRNSKDLEFLGKKLLFCEIVGVGYMENIHQYMDETLTHNKTVKFVIQPLLK